MGPTKPVLRASVCCVVCAGLLAIGRLADPVPVLAQNPSDETPPAPQEGPNVTFSVEVNYVEVDARVLDSRGNFVRDLSRDDFDVFEDGVRQDVDSFALVDIPVERPEMPLFARQPIEPDVATNAREFDGRLYLFVLDDLQTAPSRTHQVRNAAREFIETRLAANDRAAVVTVRGGSKGSYGFTDNRRLLLDAVDHFIGQKVRSETLLRLTTPEVSLDGAISAASTDPAAIERALNADTSLTTLRSAAEFLAGVRGRRKAVVYISEGIDYNIYDGFANLGAPRVVAAAHQAIAAATRSNVAFYTIDPRGLTPGTEDLIETGTSGDALVALAALRETQIAHDSLRELADGTGGFAAVDTNDFDRAFDRIVEENSSYYMLGYYPVNDRREGKRRRIEVRVRRPGTQVFARPDYVEPSGRASAGDDRPVTDGTPAALAETTRSPLPLSGGLTLSVTAAAFRGADRKASVAIVVEARGGDLRLAPADGTYQGSLDLSVTAVDRDGRLEGGERPAVTFDLRPETYERVMASGVRVLTRLDMRPGQYQLRIGGLSGGAGSRGSVFYDIEVPDFSKEDLMMSGVLLTSMEASRTLTVRADPLLDGVMPAAPTTLREFPEGDRLALFTEIYDNETRTPHRVDILTSIRADNGTVVYSNSESRSSEDLLGRPGGYGYTVQIPLAGLKPGIYVLRVEGRSRLGIADAVLRQVQFRIRG